MRERASQTEPSAAKSRAKRALGKIHRLLRGRIAVGERVGVGAGLSPLPALSEEDEQRQQGHL